VIAVQMCQQQRGQCVRAGAGGRQQQLHAASAVDQKRLAARPHERRRSRAVAVWNGTTGAEQRALNHGPGIPAGRRYCRLFAPSRYPRQILVALPGHVCPCGIEGVQLLRRQRHR
jgi:hypothetical protein